MNTMKVTAAGRVVTGRLSVGRLRAPVPVPAAELVGRIPRVARLMALAIKLDEMLKDGSIRSQAELAAVGHVSRARLTQVMNLLHLAPDIQEDILDLPPVFRGRDPVSEGELRPIAAIVDWQKQRVEWRRTATRTAS